MLARRSRGHRSRGRSRAEHARRGGVGLAHSTEEADEQGAGSRAAEWVEGRPVHDGRSPREASCGRGAERTGHSAGVTRADMERHGARKGYRHNWSEEPDALARTSRSSGAGGEPASYRNGPANGPRALPAHPPVRGGRGLR